MHLRLISVEQFSFFSTSSLSVAEAQSYRRFEQIKLNVLLIALLWDKGFRRKVSPKELARLVSELNIDSAAGAQVLPHYGHFGAPRLRTSARGQTCDCGSLSNRDAGEGEVKGRQERRIEGRERMQKEQDLCCASSCISTDPRQITVIHTAVPMAAECIAGGWKADKTRSSSSPWEIPLSVCHTLPGCVWVKLFKDCLKITSVYSCRQLALRHKDRWRNIRADRLS